MDNVNWQEKYMDEHIKVQDLESKVDTYENITIPRLKEEKINILKEVVKQLKNCSTFFMTVDSFDVDRVIKYCENIIGGNENE